jgi:AraC-like DNA-binding protein
MKVLQFTIPVPYDKSVIVESVRKSYHYPYLHRHKEVQLTWIKKGEGTLIAGNNMYEYVSGDLFLLGANMPHVFKSNPEYFVANSGKEVEALTIFFNIDGTLARTFELPEMKQCAAFIKQHQQGFKFPNYVKEEVSGSMINLQYKAGIDQLVAFFNLINVITNVKTKLDPLCTYENLPAITDNEGIRIGGIYNYIIMHYGEGLTLEDVAKIAFMTPESFCRYFKKHTGRTFVSFLNELRTSEVCKKLIAHRFENINTIAYKCGFKSITNFNRVFKLVIGVTPKSYLDNYHNNVVTLNRAVS